MGTIVAKLLNLIGLTTLLFGFISNFTIAPYISLAIGIISTVWAAFKALKMWEDWLYRRAERREKEFETAKKLREKNERDSL